MVAATVTARDELIERYLPLARRLAYRYRHGGEPVEDLVQVASMGLIKAVDGFDPSRGAAFSSYAVPTILGELRRHFRDTGWMVHVPRELQERAMRVETAAGELAKLNGHSPSVGEIGEAAGLDEEEVLEAMEAAEAYGAASLDASHQLDDGEGGPVGDTIGGEDPSYEVVEYGAAIEDTLGTLARRDRLVLYMRFVEDLTQSEIASRIGVSQMQVSRIIRGAVSRLRAAAAVE